MSAGGMSETGLRRLHDVMAGYVERGEVPGIVTLVSRRGEGYVNAIGTEAGGSGDPIRRDTSSVSPRRPSRSRPWRR